MAASAKKCKASKKSKRKRGGRKSSKSSKSSKSPKSPKSPQKKTVFFDSTFKLPSSAISKPLLIENPIFTTYNIESWRLKLMYLIGIGVISYDRNSHLIGFCKQINNMNNRGGSSIWNTDSIMDNKRTKEKKQQITKKTFQIRSVEYEGDQPKHTKQNNAINIEEMINPSVHELENTVIDISKRHHFQKNEPTVLETMNTVISDIFGTSHVNLPKSHEQDLLYHTLYSNLKVQLDAAQNHLIAIQTDVINIQLHLEELKLWEDRYCAILKRRRKYGSVMFMSDCMGSISARYDTQGNAMLHRYSTLITNIVRRYLAKKELKRRKYTKYKFHEIQYGNKHRAIRAFVLKTRNGGIAAVFHRAYMEYVARWQKKFDQVSNIAISIIPDVLTQCINKEQCRLMEIHRLKEEARELAIFNMVARRLQSRYRSRLARAKMFEERRKANPNPFPPIACGWNFSSVLSSSTGDVFTCGRGSSTGITWIKGHKSQQLLRIPRLSNIVFKIVQISAGADHMICLTSSYSVIGLGSNTCRQLAISEPDVLETVEPVAIQLSSSIVPVQVACGAATSYILTADGGVVGWGLNDCGQIGSGYIGNGLLTGKKKSKRLQMIPTSSPYFGPDYNAKPIHPISAMIKKLLYGAGKRTKHQHQKGDRPYAVTLVAGDRHAGILTDDGRVFTWGCEERGRLGHGDIRSGTGYVLEPRNVNVNDGLVVTKISAGRSHMMCVTDHYEVFSWGDNANLQLGHGDDDSNTDQKGDKKGGGKKGTSNPSNPSNSSMRIPTPSLTKRGILKKISKIRLPLWTPKLIPSLIGANVLEVECGESHSLALTESGRVLAWGNGKFGRLGHGNENDVGRPTVIDGLLGMKCIKVSAGRSTNMVLTVNEKNEKTVWSWGRGDDGRLGSGATFDLHVPEQVKGLKRI